MPGPTETASPTPAGVWRRLPLSWAWLLLLVGLKLAVHLATANRYGFFRDELYFLDCGRHLSWGYLDDAPLIGLLSRVALLLGGSLPVVRGIAALAGGLSVALAMLLARELGSGGRGQALAGALTLSAPIFLGLHSILNVSGIEVVFWTAFVLLLVRCFRTGDDRWLIAAGIVVGLGLLNKYPMVLVAIGATLGLALSRDRGMLVRWPFWLGAATAFVIFLPALHWQVHHDWPVLSDLVVLHQGSKNVRLSGFDYLIRQARLLNPLGALAALAGLAVLTRLHAGRLRPLAVLYLFLLGAMLALRGKDYYLAAAYPMLFAAAATGLDAWVRWQPRLAPLAPAITATALMLFGLIAPAELPLLEPSRLVAYRERLGLKVERSEVGHVGRLDQRLGDQFGWPELTSTVARAYNALPPEVRVRTAILAGNYGEAGAINHLGKAMGLPQAVCAHQAHAFWGPPVQEPEAVLTIQFGPRFLSKRFGSVEQVAVHHHPWGMGEEEGPIFLCREPRQPFAKIWQELRHWD